MVIFDLVLRFGVNALKLIVGKNLKALLSKDEMKIITSAVKLIKRISKKLDKDIGKECWYKSKCDCNYGDYPMVCYLKVKMLESGKRLSDLTTKDLDTCKYRRK